MSIATEPDRYRDLWAEEDEELLASEKAIADGRITIDEIPDLDLAVVTIAQDEPIRRGHRFGSARFEGVHPMALNNATDRFRLLVVHGRRYRYVDRYETWVRYLTRTPMARVDMAPLARRLDELETDATSWSADAPSGLSPVLSHDGESSLRPDAVLVELVEHLRTAPPAWDPAIDTR